MTRPNPISEIVRLNEIGTGLARRIKPDGEARMRVARALDLASLDAFVAEVRVEPNRAGWHLSGRVQAQVVQTCGITLEPLPVTIDERFGIDLVEATEPEPDEEVEVNLDDDAPDVIADARIDLGQYAFEQLALHLDPFPRKPGAVFVQPEEPAEISPFAALKTLRSDKD